MKKLLSIGIFVLFIGLSIIPTSVISFDEQTSKPFSKGNPLMETYLMPDLSCVCRGGFFRITFTIKNTGNNTIYNIPWKILINGGIIFHGRETSGIIPVLLPGEETTVESKLIFGFGPVVITFALGQDGLYDEYSRNAFVYFCYIIINPGGR